MQWKSVEEVPEFTKDREFLDNFMILLATDGIKVDTVLWDNNKQVFKVAGSIIEITHWMYPQEVFLPEEFEKLADILKHKRAYKFKG